jgi:O-antigen/teichoic acid export membrane protein
LATIEGHRPVATTQRVIRNVLSNSAGKIITLGINLLLTPVLVWHLGAANYGLLTVIGSVATYGSLLDFGMLNTVIKYVAEYRARHDHHNASTVIGTALVVYSLTGLAAVVLSVALAPAIPRLFNIADADRLTATRLVIVSGIGLGLSLPCAIVTAVLRALQRYDLVNAVSVVGSLLYAGAMIAIVQLGGGVLGVAVSGVAALLIAQLPGVWLVKRIAPELHLGWRTADRRMARKLLSFSSWLFVNDAAGLLQMKTDVVVIGALLPIAAVTPYAVCLKLSRIPKILTDQFVKVLLPLASELHARDDEQRLRTLYVWSSRLTLAIFVPFGCTIAMLGSDALTVWMGPEYGSYWPLVAVLVLALGLDMAQWPAGSILQGTARVRAMALVAAATGIANLVLSIVLARRFGLIGVALGTLIPTALASLAVVMPYSMRKIGVPAIEMVKDVMWPSLLPAIPAVMVLYALRSSFAPLTLVPLAGIAVAGIATYYVTYISMGASPSEQQTYRTFALGSMRRVDAYLRGQPYAER